MASTDSCSPSLATPSGLARRLRLLLFRFPAAVVGRATTRAHETLAPPWAWSPPHLQLLLLVEHVFACTSSSTSPRSCRHRRRRPPPGTPRRPHHAPPPSGVPDGVVVWCWCYCLLGWPSSPDLSAAVPSWKIYARVAYGADDVEQLADELQPGIHAGACRVQVAVPAAIYGEPVLAQSCHGGRRSPTRHPSVRQDKRFFFREFLRQVQDRLEGRQRPLRLHVRLQGQEGKQKGQDGHQGHSQGKGQMLFVPDYCKRYVLT